MSTAVETFAGNMAGQLAVLAVPIAGDVLGGTAIKMEKDIAGLAKATDLDGPPLHTMNEEIIGMSSSLKGFEHDALIAIATVGGQMGIAAGGLIEYTRGVAMGSAAIDDIPAGEIAEQIGKGNSVFKLGVGCIGGNWYELMGDPVDAISAIFDNLGVSPRQRSRRNRAAKLAKRQAAEVQRRAKSRAGAADLAKLSHAERLRRARTASRATVLRKRPARR